MEERSMKENKDRKGPKWSPNYEKRNSKLTINSNSVMLARSKAAKLNSVLLGKSTIAREWKLEDQVLKF
ncbi:hypothetical protein CFP56_025655 [Quercus suber]|uniref:Uncharacterized protein n=1 Tax=Quercus suber TaxID=58331 RepID=A0AAW0K2E3_QUESU